MRDKRIIEGRSRFVADEADRRRARITVGCDVAQTSNDLVLPVRGDDALRRAKKPPARASICIGKIEGNSCCHAGIIAFRANGHKAGAEAYNPPPFFGILIPGDTQAWNS